MASGTINKTFSTGYTFRLSWSESDTSAADNTSKVTVTAQLIASGSYHIDSSASKNISITIDGKKYSGTCTVGISGGQTKTLFTASKTITHTSDGSKAISISGTLDIAVTLSGSYVSSVTASGTATLSKIARASSISVSNGTLGTEQTITISRADSSFVHTLTYTCGNTSGTIATKTTGTSVSFTPPLSLASQNTTGTTVSITIKCRTYTSDGTALGSASKTITASIPSSVKPSVSLSVSDAMGFADRYGGYVQRMSKPAVEVAATTAYGSAIASYRTVIGGVSYTTASFTGGVLTTSGAVKITTTVTDQRGRTASAELTINVLAYDVPAISELSLARCNEDGTANPSGGAYLRAAFTATVTALGNKNTASYVMRYKTADGSEWTEVSLSEYENCYSIADGGGQFASSITDSYDVQIIVTDGLSNTATRSASIGTAFRIIHVNPSGIGVAIGKMSDKDAFQVGLPAEFDSTVKIDGDLSVGGSLSGTGAKAPVCIPAMTARAEADQTLTTTSATTIGMTYVRWATPGTDSYLQLTDGGIECKVAGFIEVSGRVLFSSGYTDGKHLRGGIYQNSSYQLSSSIHASTTGKYHTAVIPPAVLQVAAGDVIYLKALGDDGVVVGYEGAQHASTLTVKYIG